MAEPAAPLTIPKRSEIPEQYRWRLEDIYPDQQAWDHDYAAVREWLGEIRTYSGRLGESGQTLLACLSLRDRIDEKLERLYVYARMRRDEDSTNQVAQALVDRAEHLGVEAGEATAFIAPEILALPEETIRRYLAETEGLELYRHHLDELLRRKAHTLSPAEERLLALSGELGEAPDNIFTMLNDADLRFPVIRDEQGREVELTKARYLRFLEGRDRRVRQDAFRALYETYGKHKNTLAAILAAQVKRNIFYARARKYPSARAAALDGENIPLEVYDNLIATVREHLPLLHRYVRLRRRALGLDELHMYDLYTPIVPRVDMEVPYEEAKQRARAALAPLGKRYAEPLERALGGGWIDVFENQGKYAGGYSWGAYGTHPFILLNYQSRLDDLFTLVHELGHAMHSFFSQEAQPYVYAHYGIFVAEVASTVNEVLLFDYLRKILDDDRLRLYVINHFLEAFRGTVYRQTMFAEFEKAIHEEVENGGSLTPEWLSKTYYQLNRDYYGPDIVVDDEIALEWARIPHFYMNFYVYKYATGFSAAVALANGILQEAAGAGARPAGGTAGEAGTAAGAGTSAGPDRGSRPETRLGEEPGAVERYLRFLAGGSSRYPLELLDEAGVDMRSPEPIRQALALFGQLLDELEAKIEAIE